MGCSCGSLGQQRRAQGTYVELSSRTAALAAGRRGRAAVLQNFWQHISRQERGYHGPCQAPAAAASQPQPRFEATCIKSRPPLHLNGRSGALAGALQVVAEGKQLSAQQPPTALPCSLGRISTSGCSRGLTAVTTRQLISSMLCPAGQRHLSVRSRSMVAAEDRLQPAASTDGWTRAINRWWGWLTISMLIDIFIVRSHFMLCRSQVSGATRPTRCAGGAGGGRTTFRSPRAPLAATRQRASGNVSLLAQMMTMSTVAALCLLTSSVLRWGMLLVTRGRLRCGVYCIRTETVCSNSPAARRRSCLAGT